MDWTLYRVFYIIILFIKDDNIYNGLKDQKSDVTGHVHLVAKPPTEPAPVRCQCRCAPSPSRAEVRPRHSLLHHLHWLRPAVSERIPSGRACLPLSSQLGASLPGPWPALERRGRSATTSYVPTLANDWSMIISDGQFARQEIDLIRFDTATQLSGAATVGVVVTPKNSGWVSDTPNFRSTLWLADEVRRLLPSWTPLTGLHSTEEYFHLRMHQNRLAAKWGGHSG